MSSYRSNAEQLAAWLGLQAVLARLTRVSQGATCVVNAVAGLVLVGAGLCLLATL
jgi:hypothetical protein